MGRVKFRLAIFIMIGLLVAAGVCYGSWIWGYSQGYTEGYTEGYAEGDAVGYTRGNTAGYAKGKAVGYNEGHKEGYIEGKEVGYNEAWQKAQTKPYQLLKDPTYEEMNSFLSQDKTDQRKYSKPHYVCIHFARDLDLSAARKGIRSAVVVVNFTNQTGHTLNAFQTVDEGLIFIEPQEDWEVMVELNKRIIDSKGQPVEWLPNLVESYTINW